MLLFDMYVVLLHVNEGPLYVETCKWPTTFALLRTMLFIYVAYIIYSSGNYMIFRFCLCDIKVWYRA